MIKATVTKWAAALGRDPKTLDRKFARARVPIKRGQEIDAKTLFGVLLGDLDAARIRETTARAALLELELECKNGRLLDPEIVRERLGRCLGVIAEYMRAAEVELPSLTNPTDPEFARKAVVAWVAKFWPLVRNSHTT